MPFNHFAATSPSILGERTYLTTAIAAAGVTATVKNSSGFRAGSKSITSLTSSGLVATATTSAAHGWVTGDVVTVAGAAQTEYNGSVTITVTSTTGFTYAFAGSVTTPATGTITAAKSEYIVFGELGNEISETKLSSAVPTTTTITTAAVSFAHPINEAVYQLLFDKRRMYGSASSGGSYTLLDTQTVSVGSPQGNTFIYAGTAYEFFKVVYYNSITGVEWPALDDATELRAEASPYYTSVGRYKAWAGVSGSAKDAMVELLIPIYTDVVNAFLFGDATQTLLSRTYTETATVGTTDDLYMTDTNNDVLTLRHSPITDITSIDLDGNRVYTDGGTNLVAIDGFEGYRVFLDSVLPGGGRIRRLPLTVVYTAGFDQVPSNVELAMWNLLALGTSDDLKTSNGVSSYAIADKSVTFDRSKGGSDPLPSSVATLLMPYKRTLLPRY